MYNICTYMCCMQKGVNLFADNSCVSITKKCWKCWKCCLTLSCCFRVEFYTRVACSWQQCLHCSAFVSRDERNMCLILGIFFFGAAARMFMYICMCVCVCVSALIYKAERACSSGVLVSPYPRLCVHVCVFVCACYPVLPPPAFWCVMTTMMMMTSLFLFRYFFFYPVTFYTSHFIWKFWR